MTEFSNLPNLLEEFKESKIPEDRLFYKKSISYVISLGEKLLNMASDLEGKKRLENSLDELKEMIEEYNLYPKLKGVAPLPGKQVSLISTEI